MLKPDTHKVAVCVLLERDGKVALMERIGTDWMNGYYCPAAGKVEKNETIQQAAIRELQEEVGVIAEKEAMQFVHLAYEQYRQDDNWLDCYFVCREWMGEPRSMEVELHGEIRWFDLSSLPDKTMPHVLSAIHAWKSGLIYSEFVK